MTVSIELQMEQMGQRAKKAARVLSAAAPAAKTQALRALAALLIERQPDILKANALDVDAAKAILQDRIDSGAGDTGYPENAVLWQNNAQVQVQGNCLCLIALPDGYTIPENVFALG